MNVTAPGRLLLIPAIAAVCMLAACGDDDDEPATATATQGPTGQTATPSTSEPTRGATPAAAGDMVVAVAEADGFGEILVDERGYALYTFDQDTAGSGASSCSGGCASAWPPLEAPDEEPAGPADLPAELSTITRDDGSLQVTYDGRPLYLYGGDAKAGDVTGDGVGGVWHVATVEPKEAAGSTGGDVAY